jgi:hypothetical protein
MSTSDDQPPARRGRPALPDADRKSTNLKFRTRAGLREKLEESAEARNRSVSEEVEWRVERSFDYECIDTSVHEAFLRYMRVFFGGEHNAVAMAQMAAFWQRAVQTADKQVKNNSNWYDDETKQLVMIEVMQRGVKLAVRDAAQSEKHRVERESRLDAQSD